MSPKPRSPLLFGSLRQYRRSRLTRDLVAGLTVWAVLVPEALAYATIAGVSPVVGLYAAPAALVLYAAFGSSRHLVTGPMAATAALSAAAVASVAGDGDPTQLTIVLALVTGGLALVAGLLRLGFVANFISAPVLKGFIIGLALTIIVGQLPKLFGVEGVDGDFFEELRGWLGDLGDTHGATLAVGLVSLLIVVGFRRMAPAIPGSLIAVVFGIAAVALLGLDERGVSIVGEIDAGLPSVGFPDAAATDYLALAGAAVGIMLVGFVEGLGAAKTYATRNHYEIDGNRELLALGAANLGAGLSSGMVVNGSLSKTAVNGAAGAATQLSGIVVATLSVVTLLFLTGLFSDLPEATLAAIVIAALIELVDVGALIELYRTYTTRLGRIYGIAARPDFVAAIAALFGVLLFDTLPGLFIGIGISMLLLLYRSARPHIARLGELADAPGSYADVERGASTTPTGGVAILRVEGGIFFPNADHVRASIRIAAKTPGIRAVILDGETTPFVDVTGVQMLHEVTDDLAAQGVALAIAHGVGQVRDLIGLAGADGGPAMYPSVTEARNALPAAEHPDRTTPTASE